MYVTVDGVRVNAKDYCARCRRNNGHNYRCGCCKVGVQIERLKSQQTERGILIALLVIMFLISLGHGSFYISFALFGIGFLINLVLALREAWRAYKSGSDTAFAQSNRYRVLLSVCVVCICFVGFLVARPIELAAAKNAAVVELINEHQVYYTESSKKYHLYKDCSGMKNPAYRTEEDANMTGRTRCKICYGDYWDDY